MSLAIHTTMLLRIFCFSSTKQLRCTSATEMKHKSTLYTTALLTPCRPPSPARHVSSLPWTLIIHSGRHLQANRVLPLLHRPKVWFIFMESRFFLHGALDNPLEFAQLAVIRRVHPCQRHNPAAA